ncbi:MAG: carbohydrate kinase family protein [Actinomycetes bacterium]
MPELDLLVLGDINPDVIVSDPELVIEFDQVEETVDHAALVLGGSAAITAVGAARLGLRVGICGVVGDDDTGSLLLTRLRAEGVDVSGVRVSTDHPTGLSVILHRDGDRAILTMPGTVAALSPEDLAQLPDQMARHVHVASYFLMSEAYRSALPDFLKHQRDRGTGTSVDTNWDPEQRWNIDQVLRECDWYFPNERELGASTGSPLLERSLDVLADFGCNLAVKRGKNGGVARGGDCTYRVVRTPSVEFVDAVGAGDTFNAAFLAGRLSGREVGASLAMAVAAGTLSTAAAGGTAGQPNLDDLLLWSERLPIEKDCS